MRRDFSESSKRNLLDLVSQVENEKWSDFTDWFGDRWYDFQSLIGKLRIKNYIDNVNEYHKKVIDKNNTTKATIEQIFCQVNALDVQYSSRLSSSKSTLQEMQRYIHALNELVSPVNARFNVDSINSELIALLSELTFDDLPMQPDHVINNAKIVNDDITSNFLGGQSDFLVTFASGYCANLFNNLLSLVNWADSSNELAVRKSIETLIADTLENKHVGENYFNDFLKAVDPEEFELIMKVINLCSKTGKIYELSEIARITGVDLKTLEKSGFIEFITNMKGSNLNIIKSIGEVTEILGTFPDAVEELQIWKDVVSRLLNDYTEDLKYLEMLKVVLREQGTQPEIIDKVVDQMISDYENQVAYAARCIAEDIRDKGIDAVFGKTQVGSLLFLFMNFKDLGCDLSGLSDHVENYEMIYSTQHYSAALISKYEEYADKIRSGVYTQEDVEQCNAYFKLARNAKIQEYECIINLYEAALEDAELVTSPDLYSETGKIQYTGRLMSNGVYPLFVSDEERQAVRDEIDRIQREIDRLKGLDG